MLGDAVGGSEEINEVLCNVEGLDGADAEALDRCFVENAAEEVFEFEAGGKIAAVGAEVDAAENDFAVSRFAELLYFPDDCFRWQTAASPADERDDAVGAAGVAEVLDFEGGGSVIPFPAEDRGGKKFGAVEDVAGEDFAKQWRSLLRHYKGMERGRRAGMQGGGGEKVVCGFGGCGGGERVDWRGVLGLGGIADAPGPAGGGG